MFEKQFAIRLKRIRQNRNLTQQEVANYICISRSAYSYYECAKSQPKIETIIKLSEILKVNLEFLLTGKKINYK